MDKKKILIQVIKKLQGSRDLADGVLALLETAQVDEQLIDTLIKIISQAIKTIKRSEEQSLLEKSLQQLHKIRELEESNKDSDEEIEHILDGLE